MSTPSWDALASASAEAVTSTDITGTLVSILLDCEVAVSADATALLVNTAGELEVLSTTSHEATQLELYQTQQGEGPCVEVISTGAALIETSPTVMRERWPHVGPAVVDAGFTAVLAVPLRWQGSSFGGLNAFFRPLPGAASSSSDLEDLVPLAQLFADLATLSLVASGTAVVVGHPDSSHLRDHVGDALRGRADIERAKGVLAHRDQISLSAAYRQLLHLAHASDASLTTVARRVQRQALHRPPAS